MAAIWVRAFEAVLAAGLLLAPLRGGALAQTPSASVVVPGFPIVTGFSGSRLGVPGVNPIEKTYMRRRA